MCLIVGGGNVGLEKLNTLVKNDPRARIKVVAIDINVGIKTLAKKHNRVKLIEKCFDKSDLDRPVGFVIAATNKREENLKIMMAAKEKRLLVNVADTPDLCDFYLGSTVRKGNLKIGISTNGLSPTFAKRFRQLLEEVLPDSTDSLLTNLRAIRNQLKGDFRHKVNVLSEITGTLLSDGTYTKKDTPK